VNGLNGFGQVVAAMNQNMAQMNANLRQMGDGAAQAINGYYAEAKRFVRSFDEQRGLRYRPATISLSANITGAGSAVSGANDFRVAQNEDFLVQSMRGFIVLNDQASEPVPPANLGATLSPLDRAIAKALNCRVQLINKDTKVPIMENESISLATICPEAGGEVLIFQPNVVPGFIIPHNMTVQAQFTLQSPNAFFNTASTNYGISLTGVYMSRELR
jgi:hypothetical protein